MNKDFYPDRIWKFCLAGILTFGSWAIAIAGQPTFAQNVILPDNTLGIENSDYLRFAGLRADVITGGAVRERNLFHSFQEFNVAEGWSAYFDSPAGIQNILARVTGTNRSEILGTLGTFGASQPNLFLINPNGILFGPNASLDVGGSFIATTASAVQFGDRGFFSAVNPQVPGLLTVDPSALFFNQLNAARIENRSQELVGFDPSGNPLFGLQVPDGRSLLLVGGDILLNQGGRLNALGGRIELGGLAAPGTIGLTMNGNAISLNFAPGSQLANVTLDEDSRVSVRGTGGGDIVVHASNFTATQGGRLVAGTEGAGDAGNIWVFANQFNISGVGTNSSGLYNQSLPDATGNGGNVVINTQTFNATDGAAIALESYGAGRSGDIQIVAPESLTLLDGAIQTVAFDPATGDAGNISIATGHYLASGEVGYLWSGTYYGGRNAGNITLSADTITLLNGSSIDAANRYGAGNAGSVELTTNTITLLNGSKIDTSNRFGAGNAGNVELTATTDINFSGKSYIFTSSFGFGRAGKVTVNAGGAIVFDNSDIDSNASDGAIQAGDIQLSARSLSMTNGSRLGAFTSEVGGAGNVNVQTTEFVSLANDSSIPVFATGTGTGGKIFIETQRLSLLNGSDLFASVLSSQPAGSITVNASESVDVAGSWEIVPGRLSGSKISIDTIGDGNAGNLTINTRRLSVRDGGQISTSTAFGQGSGGNLVINASEAVEVRGNTPDGLHRSMIGAETGGMGAAGNIWIRTGRFTVSDGASVRAFTLGSGQGGTITVEALESTEISGTNPVFPFSILGWTELTTESSGSGGAGDIRITTGKLIVRDGASVAASTSGSGQGGTLGINASESVEVAGTNPFAPVLPTKLTTGSSGSGRAGDIQITTGRLVIRDGASIAASTFSSGQGGVLDINASNSVEVVGTGSRNLLRSQLTTGTSGTGNAGDLKIYTGRLAVLSGGFVGAGTANAGRGGSLFVNASTIDVAGKTPDGRFSSGLTVGADPASTGVGGNLEIVARRLTVRDGAEVTVSSDGTGNAGNLDITASSILLDNQGKLIAATRSGEGGNIRIRSDGILFLRHNSLISATAGGTGNGGNVDVAAQFVIAIPQENSDIIANAFQGRGGNVNITTQAIFGLEYRPQLTPLSDITASSEFGLAGVVQLNIPDVNVENALAQLATAFVNPDRIIASSCIARRNQRQGSFVVTGTGGLPASPSGSMSGWYEVPDAPTSSRDGTSGQTGSSAGEADRRVAIAPWKPGDPIREAEGMVTLPNGRIVLGTSTQLMAISDRIIPDTSSPEILCFPD